MTVKTIIKIILERTGWTRYRLAKEVGLSTQALDYMIHTDTKGVRLSVLCKLREVSGLSWSAFGKILDGQFAEIDDKGE
jgi:DNA-binding Xre family transcriptional regulator